jgi:hypothetical protein
VVLALTGAGRVGPHGPAADGGERLVAQRVVHDAGERARGVLARDAHAPQRDAREVVDRAVERVDDPAQPGAPVAIGRALLAQHAVGRPPPGEHRGDRGLRRAVGVRDEVGRPLLGAEPAGRAAVAGGQLGARAERRLPGDVEDVAGHDARAHDLGFWLHTDDFTTPWRRSSRGFTTP